MCGSGVDSVIVRRRVFHPTVSFDRRIRVPGFVRKVDKPFDIHIGSEIAEFHRYFLSRHFSRSKEKRARKN